MDHGADDGSRNYSRRCDGGSHCNRVVATTSAIVSATVVATVDINVVVDVYIAIDVDVYVPVGVYISILADACPRSTAITLSR